MSNHTIRLLKILGPNGERVNVAFGPDGTPTEVAIRTDKGWRGAAYAVSLVSRGFELAEAEEFERRPMDAPHTDLTPVEVEAEH
jgi:hypothetical protein